MAPATSEAARAVAAAVANHRWRAPAAGSRWTRPWPTTCSRSTRARCRSTRWSCPAPDGQPVAPQNPAKGKTRSSFDLELRQAGTYRIAVAENTVMARWEEDGKPKRWRGTPAEMATGIPANAAKLEVEQTQRRVETFVSVGTPTEVKPGAGTGIELKPGTASERSVCARNREVSFPARRQARARISKSRSSPGVRDTATRPTR